MEKIEIDEVKAGLMKKQAEPPIKPRDLLSTGSTLLNLACTGDVRGGFIKGKYIFFVGDSMSGKTFLCLTCFAEATINSNFKNYRLIYDNSEDGALMDIEKFFGTAAAERIEPPAVDKSGDAIYSETIDEFFFNLDDAAEIAVTKDRPFIYVMDSMDSLSSEAEGKKFDERKKSHRKGTKAKGDYGDGKAKTNASGIRQILPKLRDSGSILIVIAQTRDNIGFGAERNPKTRSGGRALRFYATHEIWSSVIGKIKKTFRGKPRQIGTRIKCQIKKNRSTGQEHSIELPIYHSLGIDDIGSCIDFLIDESHWKKAKKADIDDGKSPKKRKSARARKTVAEEKKEETNEEKKAGAIIDARPDFQFTGKPAQLIKFIEENNRERDLRDLVQEVWEEIEEGKKLQRKPRY